MSKISQREMNLQKPSLLAASGWSILGHAVFLGLVAIGLQMRPHYTPSVQKVLTTKLVRLGKLRDKALLPRKEEPPAIEVSKELVHEPPAPSPPSAQQEALSIAQKPNDIPKITPTKAKPPIALERAQALGKVDQTLKRLQQQLEGDPQGDKAGDVSDAALALLGNRYATLVQRCIKQHYEIEGIEPGRVAGLSVVMSVWISPEGRIQRFALQQSSGYHAFDVAVQRAIQLCRKLEAPPAELRRSLSHDGLEIIFKP